jgi:hypothetical protein
MATFTNLRLSLICAYWMVTLDWNVLFASATYLVTLNLAEYPCAPQRPRSNPECVPGFMNLSQMRASLFICSNNYSSLFTGGGPDGPSKKPLVGWVVSHALPWDAGDRLCDLVSSYQTTTPLSTTAGSHSPTVHHAAKLGLDKLQLIV